MHTLKVNIREVKKQDLYFAPVVRINDTSAGVDEVLRRQPASRCNSSI